GGKKNLAVIAAHCVKDWPPAHPALALQRKEFRRLQDPGADIETHTDHRDAEQKRDSPAPYKKLVAGRIDAEAEHAGGEHRPERSPAVRESPEKAAPANGRVLDHHQN